MIKNSASIVSNRFEAKPQVILLETSNRNFKNNNYLVIDHNSHDAVIVDPAWEIEKIVLAIKNARANLGGILITHSHNDHIHLAKPLAEKYNCPIWMSRVETAASGFCADQLVGIEESPWFVGQMKIQPVLTPGHTVGSTCYMIDDNLFTGDVLFAEGCGICPDQSAAYTMFSSLEKLKVITKPHVRVYPGHTIERPPGQEFSKLLRNNIYLQFPNKEMFAAFRLRKGQNNLRMFNTT